MVHHYRYTSGENEYLQEPIKSWDVIKDDLPQWTEKHKFEEADDRFNK